MAMMVVEFRKGGVAVCEEKVEVPAGEGPRFAVIAALLRHNLAPAREELPAIDWDIVRVDGENFGQKLPRTREDYLCSPDYGVMLSARIKAMRGADADDQRAA